MKKIIVCILICSVFKPSLFSQNVPLTFEKVTVQEGTAGLIIYCMMQDSKGYLWIGTGEGLTRYDGNSSRVYKFDPDDTTSLSNNIVLNIFQDRQGLFWIGTSGGGLCQFDPLTEKFTNYVRQAKQAGLKNQDVISITEDNEGMLWVTTIEEASRFDRKTNKFIRFKQNLDTIPGNGSEGLNAKVFKDSEGTIWLANFRRGLTRANPVSMDVNGISEMSFVSYVNDPANPKSISSDRVTAIFEDFEKVLWLGTLDGGINRFNRATGDFTRYVNRASDSSSLSSNKISPRGFTEDKNGNLWISTAKGLNKLDPKRTRFTTYNLSPVSTDSNSNQIGAVLVDNAGTLWVAKFGLHKANLSQKQVQQFLHEPGNSNSLSASNVHGLCEDRDGIIWIATHGGGLNRYDKKKNKFTHYRHSKGFGQLRSDFLGILLEDKNGNLWLGGGSFQIKGPGFCMLERKTGKFKYFLDSVGAEDQFIFSIFEDREGIIWFGTSNGVRNFDPKTNLWCHYTTDSLQLHSSKRAGTRAIGEDNNGNIWIGTQDVLNKFNKITAKTTHYQYDPRNKRSISGSQIQCIYNDSKGNLWIGTLGGGLYLYNPATDDFTRFTEKKGLPNNSVLGIVEDDQNFLWLATSKGICRFSPTDSIFYHINLTNRSDPFYVPQVNSKVCFKGKDGILYFGGENGFIMVQPKELTINKFIPPVVITEVKLYDQPMKGKQEDGQIILDHNNNYLSFEFAALNYINSDKNQYAYQLEGIDKDWVYSGARRFASYPQLPHGDYIFRVKGSNNDGLWNEKGASIKITIHPPWWKTWWFIIVCFVALVTLSYLFVRWYTHRKLEMQRVILERKQAIELERMRISSDLHDDVGGELSAIRLLSELNLSDTDPKQQLTKISRSSGEIVKKMNEIVWALNINNDNLLSLVSYIRQFAIKFLDDVKINCDFKQPENIPQYAIDGNSRRNIFLLVKESLNNVVKHANATQVNIDVSATDNLVITIHDNGNGISEGLMQHSTGNGLRNMRQRVKELEGIFDIKNQQGTTLIFQFPILKDDTKV